MKVEFRQGFAPLSVRPESIIDAIVEGVAVLDRKAAELKAAKKGA